MQTVQQGGGGSVKEFVIHTKDPAGLGGGRVLPAALSNHLFQGNSISGAAPCGNDYLRIELLSFVGGGLATGRADKLSSRGFHQFGNPRL